MESEKQSYEDRTKALKKVFSVESWSEVTCVYMLLNLNPEKSKTQPSTPTQQQDSI